MNEHSPTDDEVETVSNRLIGAPADRDRRQSDTATGHHGGLRKLDSREP
jgi:hypothetical protein